MTDLAKMADFVFLMSRGYAVRHVTDSLASIGCQY